MSRAAEQRILHLLNNENLEEVIAYSCARSIDPETGLNQILEDWKAERDRQQKKEEFKKESLSYIQEYLSKIDGRLSWIEGRLADLDI